MRLTLPLDPSLPRRWWVGEQSGDTFVEDDDFRGTTLVLELLTPAEAKAVTAALLDLRQSDQARLPKPEGA